MRNARFQSKEVAETFAAAVRREGYWASVVGICRKILCADGGWDFVETMNNRVGYKVVWYRNV